MSIALSEIHIYPVKSMKGVSLRESRVTAHGLEHDRRWMVVDNDGTFLSQRELPRMALITAAIQGRSLILTAPNMPPLAQPLKAPASAPTLSARVWRSTCEVQAACAKANGWLSSFLGVPCRLVYMPDETRRAVNPDYAVAEGIVSFADGYPLLLIGQASLDDLNQRLDTPVPMSRFRPNVVVSGAVAYEEDTWKTIRIGDVTFHVVKPCDRCVVTTIDQGSGERVGEEPLRTLASYRLHGQKVLFGMNMIPATDGNLQIGDCLEVLA